MCLQCEDNNRKRYTSLIPDNIVRITRTNKGREFDFNHFVPQPENLYRDNLSTDKEKELESQGLPNWYRWNNENWGTKWNAVCDDEMGISVDGFPFEHEYNLRTAWAFPSPVISKMIDMYPNLDFAIVGEEESMEFT